MHENRRSTNEVQKVLARARNLQRRDVRDREKCFWIEGVRQFVQACDARMHFEAVIESPVLNPSRLAEMLARRLAAAGTLRIKVSPEQFRSLCSGARASGIGAIGRQCWTPIEEANRDDGLCWLVMSQVRAPGNLGTILRTAEAVGVSGVIFVGPQCDPFDPIVVRSSMGGLFHLPLVRTTIDALRSWINRLGIRVVGLSPSASTLWTEFADVRAADSQPIVVVLGEERSGISEQLQSLCHTQVRLPMCGNADSLNVGIAAGVMMYELVRRQNQATSA